MSHIKSHGVKALQIYDKLDDETKSLNKVLKHKKKVIGL